MPRYTITLTALIVTAVTAPAAAQRKPAASDTSPPSADSLAAISRRGRALAELDHAAWLGSDAMESLSLPADGVRRFIVRRTERGWEVVAGVLSAQRDTLFIAQLSTPGMQPDRWAASTFDPPRADTGYFLRAARAIETSLTMFRPAARRPYVATAVPDEAEPWWWVYVYPAPSRAGVWPRGGDMRFRVSADGRVITENRRLHQTITEYSARTARSGSDVTSGGLPLVSGVTPEDTDVFHVLQRRPALPELFSAGPFRYRIDVDGTIRLVAVAK